MTWILKDTLFTEERLREKEREKNIFLLYFRMFQSNSSWKKGMAREYSGVLSWIMSLWLIVALRIILHNPCLNPECSVISTLLTIFLMTYFHNQLVSTKEGFQMLQVSLEICFSHFNVLCINYVLMSLTNIYHVDSGFLSFYLNPLLELLGFPIPWLLRSSDSLAKAEYMNAYLYLPMWFRGVV